MGASKRRERGRGFRRNIYLYVFVLVFLTLLGGTSFYVLRIELLRNTQDMGDSIARSYASEERNNLIVYETLMEFGTEMIDLQMEDGREMAETEEMIISFFRRMTATLGNKTVDPYVVLNGRILAANPWEGDEGYDVSGTEWYQKAMEADGEIVFTNLYTDAIYQRPVITIAKKCRLSDTVMAFDIFPENFQFQNSPLALPEDAAFYLCDGTGALIYGQSNWISLQEQEDYLPQLVESIRRGEQEAYTSYIYDSDGNKGGVYYSYLANGWISVITVPYSTILQKLNLFAAYYVAVLMVAAVVVGVLIWRDFRLSEKVDRTNETVRVLGNSYFALYRVNFGQGTYEMIKGSDFIRSRIPAFGEYDRLLDAMKELIEPGAYQEYVENFSLQSIRNLVVKRVRDFGGDFQRKFGEEYRWVSVRVLFDESLSPEEAVLCFREVEEEKQRRFQERKLLEEALENSKRSEKNKHAFFSNMSHDMRTPLNAIIGLSELVQQNLRDPKKISGYMDKISLSSRQLLGLINDILDMSRMEQGKVALDYQHFNIRECVEDCAGAFRLQAEAEQKDFRVSFDLEDEEVLGDPFRISQILNNLLSNALKFTAAGDRIRVEVSQFRHQNVPKYKIVISDTGVGMSEEFLPQLFEPYARETRFGERRVAGTGLGMPIVKNLVTQMSGQINVDSAPGKGTAITIVIPLEAVKEEKTEKEEPSVSDREFSLEGRTVLLAEDNMVNMEIATEILTMSGATVIQAWNGLEAVEKFRGSAVFSIDVILMDMQMPQMDGCEAARNIRALPRPDAKNVPIIAVTANAFAEDIAATTAAGMNAHVSKPIDFGILQQTMEKLIRARE